MNRFTLLAAAVLVAVLGCSKSEPTTSQPAPTTEHEVVVSREPPDDPEKVRIDAMLDVLRTKAENMAKRYEELQKAIDEHQKNPPDTNKGMMAQLLKFKDLAERVNESCDELKTAVERYERAAGVQPKGQDALESADKMKKIMANYLERNKENREALAEIIRAQDKNH